MHPDMRRGRLVRYCTLVRHSELVVGMRRVDC